MAQIVQTPSLPMTLARSAAVGLIAVLMCSTSALAQPGRIDPARLNEATRVLASDEFEGRAPVTPGEDRTIEWLSQQFQALGLEPGGPNGSWVQVAQVSRTSQDGPAAISVSANGRTTELQRAKDVIVSSDRPVERITLTDAPLVFVGYGVDAPERGWDDYKGVDLTGKIMLVLVNDPDFAAPEGHPVNGAIVGRVKGGFTVDLGGASAFLPGSQVDIRPVRDVGPLMGKEQPFAILTMDRPRGNIVVSRRAILEEARAEQRTELVGQLQEGEVREGVVKNITDYGAFVDLGGIDGLLHVTDM